MGTNPGTPDPTDPRELYEHLEVLLLATEGTSAEASFDYVVDRLLRHTVYHSAQVEDEANAATAAISRWQRTYRPTVEERVQRVDPRITGKGRACICSGRRTDTATGHTAACDERLLELLRSYDG